MINFLLRKLNQQFNATVNQVMLGIHKIKYVGQIVLDNLIQLMLQILQLLVFVKITILGQTINSAKLIVRKFLIQTKQEFLKLNARVKLDLNG